jgi:hypothetical protein
MRWLAAQYFDSPEFAGFVPKSQVFRRQIIESLGTLDELVSAWRRC